MAVRDLLWACPICRAPGRIRPAGRTEQCAECRASFRRGAGSCIRITTSDGRTLEERAPEWLDLLGPAVTPPAGENGIVLGPESVRVKTTRHQKPMYFGGELLGWVEVYGKPVRGTMTLRHDGLHFQPGQGPSEHWRPEDLKGIQPASASLQIGFHGHMKSVKFIEGAVRLWTRAVTDMLRRHYSDRGLELLELQPSVRTCPLTRLPE